jgi:hypothetical protein
VLLVVELGVEYRAFGEAGLVESGMLLSHFPGPGGSAARFVDDPATLSGSVMRWGPSQGTGLPGDGAGGGRASKHT